MGSSYTSRGGYVDDYDKRYETSRADHRELDVEREKPSSRRYEDSYSSQRSKSRRYTKSKSPGGQRTSRSPDTDHDNRRRSRSRGELRGHRRRTRSRSRSRGHSRSRDYERGGSRSCRRTRSRSREDSRGRWTKRRRTRSKSPVAAGSSVKNELKTEADNYYNDYDDDWVEEDVDLGYGVTSRDLVGLSREEKIAVRDKYCDLCQVSLGDPASMVGHVRGMKHIQAKKDRGLPVPGLVDTTDEPVDTKFWIKQENKKRVEEASKNSAYDVSKVNQQKAKFNKRSCDNGQFRNMYCDICGVTVHSRDTYENHIQGAEHKRRAEKPITYKCDLCHVYVPCQNSLNSHFQGKDHIKRLNERSVRKGLGYDDNAQAPNSLSRDEEKEYRELKTQVNNLQRQVKDLNAKNIECRKKHKTTKELQDKKNELDREIAYYKRRCKELDDQMEQMSNAIPKREFKDEKIKTELKPKKEEYVEKENDNFEVIDVE